MRVDKIRDIANWQTRVKKSEREEQVIRLREEGHSNHEIAEALGLTIYVIGQTVSTLLTEGRVKSQRAKAFWRNLGDERVQTIIKMVKERATLQMMGDALGCSRERVRQMIGWMRAEHGDGVLASDETVWTLREAADELSVKVQLVLCLCRSGEVPTQRRGVKSYLICEEGMRILRAHPRVTRERKCVICKQTFTLRNHRGRQISCSDKCEAGYDHQKQRAYAEQEPTLDSLQGWHRALWQKLQTHRILKNEEWLTISEAAQRTGLSKTQLAWLRKRNFVTIKPDPVKIANRTGQPMATYAASEMEISRQVFEAYARSNCS